MSASARPLWLTLFTAAVADAAAVAVAFGVPLTSGQQTAILAFVGSAGAFGSALVAAWHTHQTRQAVTLHLAAGGQAVGAGASDPAAAT